MDKRLVRVVWIDASDPESNESWYSDKDVDDFAESTCEVVSVGWIKSHTKNYLTLVADYIEGNDGKLTWGRPTKVPHGMIQRIDDLVVSPSEVQTDTPEH